MYKTNFLHFIFYICSLVDLMVVTFNSLKPSGYFMYHQFQHLKILPCFHPVYVFLWISDKELLFPVPVFIIVSISVEISD